MKRIRRSRRYLYWVYRGQCPGCVLRDPERKAGPTHEIRVRANKTPYEAIKVHCREPRPQEGHVCGYDFPAALVGAIDKRRKFVRMGSTDRLWLPPQLYPSIE